MGRVRRPALARSPDPARSHARARHESARDGARQDGVFLATSLAAPRVLRLTGIAQRSDSTLGPGGPRTSYEGFGRSIVPCVAHGGGVTPRGSGFVRDTGWQGSSEGLFVRLRSRRPERAYMDILKNVTGSILRRHTSRWMTTFRGVHDPVDGVTLGLQLLVESVFHQFPAAVQELAVHVWSRVSRHA